MSPKGELNGLEILAPPPLVDPDPLEPVTPGISDFEVSIGVEIPPPEPTFPKPC
jgi:hypothetical protein